MNDEKRRVIKKRPLYRVGRGIAHLSPRGATIAHAGDKLVSHSVNVKLVDRAKSRRLTETKDDITARRIGECAHSLPDIARKLFGTLFDLDFGIIGPLMP